LNLSSKLFVRQIHNESRGSSKSKKTYLVRQGYRSRKTKGWAANTIFELADDIVIAKLLERGVTPTRACYLAELKQSPIYSAGTVIAGFAQDFPGAVSNKLKALGKPVDFGPSDWRPRFLIRYGLEVDKFTFQEDLREFYSKDWTEADISAAIILDLKRLAEQIVDRAGKPLWTATEVE
jgi:hypothetical protein